MWSPHAIGAVGVGYSATTPVDSVSETVDAMMRECLAYHVQQETRRNEASANAHAPSPEPTPPPPHDAVTVAKESKAYFVPSVIQDDTLPWNDTPTRVAHGTARALAVLARLASPLTTATTPASTLYAEQRRIAFEREEQRNHQAFCKNLAYLWQKERARIQALDAQWLPTTHVRHTDPPTALYQHALAAQRTHAASATHATSATHAATVRRKRPRHDATTATVYVAGIPTDTTEATEAWIRTLFGSYGAITKVHLYRDKTSGVLKGDCLVVYSIPDSSRGTTMDATRHPLVESVCLQMNGAELPSGHVLRVEPGYQDTVSTNDNATQAVVVPTTSDAAGGATDDLDEFFDSI